MFVSYDYFEVEILMLQVQYGGVFVWLFIIYFNVFDIELYLWIVLELYFKCVVVGGIEWVFEINWNFCNEGVDLMYSFEFVMFEVYQVYGDYNQMVVLMQELVQKVVIVVVGFMMVIWVDGIEYDLGGEWDCILMYEFFLVVFGCIVILQDFVEDLIVFVEESGVDLFLQVIYGKFVEEFWEYFVKGGLV